MLALSVRLFGKFCIRRHERILDGLDAHKLQELFGYLLLYRQTPHPRESLAALLWGESPTAQSKKYLRQVLWQLQHVLNPRTDATSEPVLRLEPDWVRLNPRADLWLDVAVFEQAFAQAQGVPSAQLEATAAQALQEAVQLYQGDLLEGWYQDWCLCERERLQNLYLAMLDKLMGYCEAHQEYEIGLAYGARVLRCDRASERTHRRLMRLHYLAGDRTAALRQYQRCIAALEEELGVKPAKRTVALYEQIHADQFEALPPAQTQTTLQMATVPLPEVLDRLQQLRAILSDIQQQVQREIQVVKLALHGRR